MQEKIGMMKSNRPQIVLLLAISVLILGVLIYGLLTGSLETPARGRGAIHLAQDPVKFWLCAVFYAGLSGIISLIAYRLSKRTA